MAGLAREDLAISRIRAFARDPLRLFVPSPGFRPFVISDAKKMALRAANRVGKTRHAAYKLARRMVDFPNSRCRIVGPSRFQTQQVLGRYLNEFIGAYLHPRSHYIHGRGWNSTVVQLKNGSICQLKSYEDRSDTHAGDSLDLIIMDEPPPKAHFSENQARVIDRKGQFIVAFTAVNRPVDYLRRVIEEPAAGWTQYVVPFRREYVPWYSDEQYEAMLQAFRSSPWEWAQRVDAEWAGVTEGRIFASFDGDNISENIPRYDLSFGIGIDHGRVAGRQVGILVAWKASKVHVIEEYRCQWGTTPEEDARGILAMLRRCKLKPTDISLAIGDTNQGGRGWRVNDLIEEAMKKELGGRHPPFRIRGADKAAGTVDYGLRIVNHAAARKDLLVHPRCSNILETLRHWRGKTDATEDGQLAHAADALRYILAGILQDQPAYSHLRLD